MFKKIISLIILILVISSFSLNSFAMETDRNVDYNLLATFNIMNGDQNGDLHLDDYITRAEFAKMAVNVSTSKDNVSLALKVSPFYDVKNTHWASAYIKTSVDAGLFSGYLDGSFKPNNNITYEEVLTVVLRVLGYTDDDFGTSWPYSQLGIASNIGLSDNIDVKVGQPITRREVAQIIYDALDINYKNSTNKLINVFKATIIEDVVLLATSNEDNSIPANKILTSNGLFDNKIKNTSELLGKKGKLVIKDNNKAISFITEDLDINYEKYFIYSIVDNNIVTFKDGQFSNVKVDDTDLVYYNGNQALFGSVKSGLSIGNVINIKRNFSGDIEYITVNKGDIKGPNVYSLNDKESLKDFIVLKKGKISNVEELKQNDIYYYSSNLGLLLAYEEKVTGIYENAIPNKELLKQVIISGNTYNVESSLAFSKLSTVGEFKYGDIVTIYLGKDGGIANVESAHNDESTLVGYLINAGIKEATNTTNESNSKKTEYFIQLVLTDGTIVDYTARRDFSDYINSVGKIEFKDGVANFVKENYRYNNNKKISGMFNAEYGSFGDYIINKNIEILDIQTTQSHEMPLYVTVYPQRLNGVSISSSSVLYYELNEKNEVIKLILEDVTNDYYQFGIAQKVVKNDEGNMLFGSYLLNINGAEQQFTSNNQIFGVSSGNAVKMILKNGQLTHLTPLSSYSGNVDNVTHTYAEIKGNKYLLSDDVLIYYKNYDFDYFLITMDELIENKDDKYKNITAYYDKTQRSGGRIRILVVR